MFYDFIYLAKGFRMRPKVQSTLNGYLLTFSRVFYDIQKWRVYKGVWFVKIQENFILSCRSLHRKRH